MGKKAPFIAVLVFDILLLGWVTIIHSKGESPRSPGSARYLAFSAKRLTDNAKTIRFPLFVELTLTRFTHFFRNFLRL